ncbi:MAG: hypothetical protein HN348_25745 [Proteobacteria bacterium]|nr:hypothetical protein [Pseudomonadota bacterium]
MGSAESPYYLANQSAQESAENIAQIGIIDDAEDVVDLAACPRCGARDRMTLALFVAKVVVVSLLMTVLAAGALVVGGAIPLAMVSTMLDSAIARPVMLAVLIPGPVVFGVWYGRNKLVKGLARADCRVGFAVCPSCSWPVADEDVDESLPVAQCAKCGALLDQEKAEEAEGAVVLT